MANLAVSADYLHSQQREMLMVLNLNPQFRASDGRRPGDAGPDRQHDVDAGDRGAAGQVYPGFVPYTGAVNQFVNRGEVGLQRGHAADEEALQPQLQRAGVVYLWPIARQHDRQRRSWQQLPGRRRHAPRVERGADRASISRTTSRSAVPRSRAQDEGAAIELGGSRAERHAVHASSTRTSTRIRTAFRPSRFRPPITRAPALMATR